MKLEDYGKTGIAQGTVLLDAIECTKEDHMLQKSILAHLAPLLTNQIENVATDALAHLLSQYDFVADAFIEHISSVGIALPKNLTVKTQAKWQDAAIPDLVGLDEEGRHLLIVESKFWAPLTPNQPATYIERLPHDTPALLLFIAPASRTSTLWQELLSRCNPLHINRQSQQETKTQFHTLRLNNNHILALTSWESLLAVLYATARQAGDEYASGDIWQLQSLCARIDAEAFKPLSEDEIKSPTEMRKKQFQGLVDELVMLLADSGIAYIAGYRATPGPDYYKRYMSLQGIPNWCIEYNEKLRRQHPPTSLWLTVYYKSSLSGLLSALTSVGFHQGKQFLIPLRIPSGVEKEAVLTSLLSQITEVSRRLANQPIES